MMIHRCSMCGLSVKQILINKRTGEMVCFDCLPAYVEALKKRGLRVEWEMENDSPQVR